MRKYFILFLAINITSLYALIGGAGINIVQDQFTISEKIDELIIGEEFTTSEINNPVGVGGFVYLTLIPFIDLEAGYNLTMATYKYEYFGLDELEVPIGKKTWYTSVLYPFFSPPTMRLYVGAGANGTEWIQPITIDILSDLESEGKKFDDEDALLDALTKSSSGYHIELGARFKPPLFPMSINGNARYIMDEDFHNDVDGYLTLTVGLAFAI